MTNRRDFLKHSSVLVGGGILAANSSVSAASKALPDMNAKKSFGLQTYSLTCNRDDQEYSSNVPGGLKRLAQMGYSTLELAGYSPDEGGRIGGVPMAEFKKYADAAGLKIVASHVGSAERGLHTRANLQAHLDHWKRVADHHATIGCKYVIQPGLPSTRNVAEVALVGEHYNEIGKLLKAAGLTFGFHNHSGEFHRVFPGGQMALPLGQWPYGTPEGSKIIMDGLLEVFDPSLVVFELDVYWCVMGLQDPVAWMKKYPRHIRLLHIKDVSVLGESGMMNFQKIFETGYANGVTDYIVELEYYPQGTQFEGVKGCADYLLAANFVK